MKHENLVLSTEFATPGGFAGIFLQTPSFTCLPTTAYGVGSSMQ